MDLNDIFLEEDKLRGENDSNKTSKANIAIEKAELEFKELFGDVKMSEEDKLREEEFITLRDKMNSLKKELHKCRRAKNPRKNVEYNKQISIKRKRIIRDMEEVKLKLQDLQYEIQGSMMKGSDIMSMQTMTEAEKEEKKQEFKKKMMEKMKKV